MDARGTAIAALLVMVAGVACGGRAAPTSAERPLGSGGAGRAEPANDANESDRFTATRELIDARARELIERTGVVGASIALIADGEIVFETGWGFADLEHLIRADAHTIYWMGSLSKPVTAAAAMRGIERGTLTLDERLSHRLPDLELAAQAQHAITLEDLLTHRSGLPSDWLRSEFSYAPPDWTGVVDELAGSELPFAPGEVSVYSNVGFALAGLALARAEGRPYEAIVAETVFEPLGMGSASFSTAPVDRAANDRAIDGGLQVRKCVGALWTCTRSDAPSAGTARAVHSLSYDAGVEVIEPVFRLAPAGGLRASVHDLAQFVAMLQRGGLTASGARLLSTASLAAMLEPRAALARDVDSRFGAGFLLDHAALDWVGRVAWQPGRTWNQHAIMIVLPDHGLGVVVATNARQGGAFVADLAVEGLLAALLDVHDLSAPPPKPLTPTASDQIRTQFLDLHGGRYATGFGVVTLARFDGQIALDAPFERTPLDVVDSDHAVVRNRPQGSFGFVDVGGEHVLTMTREGRSRRVGVRLGEVAPATAVWRARQGRWAQVIGRADIAALGPLDLTVGPAGELRVAYAGRLTTPAMPVVEVLEVLDEERAKVVGWARGQGHVVSVTANPEGERLHWLGAEFRRSAGFDLPP